ncbi:hypothetical protein [Sinorhizobium sp. RAC02]|uniref:hypothetical protein n=1 Tax=Sinorhizobium sp. RAC02 TaxID=1842534 RepID=UPI002570E19B|nr:hypothetical protein [Sinorhizobium sp. RAC02]
MAVLLLRVVFAIARHVAVGIVAHRQRADSWRYVWYDKTRKSFSAFFLMAAANLWLPSFFN